MVILFYSRKRCVNNKINFNFLIMKFWTMSAEGGSAFGGKKIIFFLALILILSGCQTQETKSDTNTNSDLQAQKEAQYKLQIEKLSQEDLLGQYNGAILKTNLGDIKVKIGR